MDSLKQAATDSLRTAKFEGVHIHIGQAADKRLAVSVEASASIDLPGDMDELVAKIAAFFKLGKSSGNSPA